jgi:hypothetical protein
MPDALRRGREFERLVKTKWQQRSEVTPLLEHATARVGPKVSRGRVDIFVHADLDPVWGEPGSAVAGRDAYVVEIKATEWDRIPARRVAPYVRRQARQVWDYLEAALDDDSPFEHASGSIVFPRKPGRPGLARLIEMMFLRWALDVHWFEEDERTAADLFDYEEIPIGNPRSDFGTLFSPRTEATDRTDAIREQFQMVFGWCPQRF